MIVIACWAVAVAATAIYGLLLTVSEVVAHQAAPVLLVLVLPCWLYLVHYLERNRACDSRR